MREFGGRLDKWLDPGDLYDEVPHDVDCDDDDCDGSCIEWEPYYDDRDR